MIKVQLLHCLGYGLTDYLLEKGWHLYQNQDGDFICEGAGDNPQSLIDSYNPWPFEKLQKFAEIDNDFQNTVNGLTSGWPEGEIKTWERQEKEAIALQSDPLVPTPFLTTVANQRGLTVAELASRVIRDSIAFSNASAYYVGLRHKARQLVQALPNEGNLERLPELWSIKFGG